ncbi:related to cation translocating ATPases [Cephalotrichum gorgonifer]|uniref:Cation-transporting ATPase n=1 Tax=Cephalotrichum gorgonifer TaxID=2041049 RepID=A0AAE8MU52_9PEZI|nr:related to cation translocating ATPases [Cephalotrichum gorgonifer]
MDEDVDHGGDPPGSYSGNGHAPFYNIPANQSASSIFEDVEMAQNEQFAGPMAESLPTSLSAFSHRRSRADSVTSYTYHQDEDEDEVPVPVSLYGEADFGDFEPDHDDEFDNESLLDIRDDIPDYVSRRRSSTLSRSSARARLLRRDSAPSVASTRTVRRVSQKTYLVNEDLTMVVAGFETSRIGYLAYLLMCIFTLGTGYLLFRWIPRWYVAVVGSPCPLGDCDWVVVENQWGEMSILEVETRPYERPLSTVFGYTNKAMAFDADDDFDPLLPELRIISYRYVRLFFHPVKDVFVLFNGWKDPAWTDVKAARSGVDAEEKTTREVVFGSNLIDIEQKSIPKLLVDETMKRLREISRFECDVRVLRNGFWRYISSGDMVPGDVYEVSDPGLTQFPADSLLLSGDCIVNESMLTGESIPVSKLPATDETLHQLDLAASTMSPGVGRHFLFCGTRIVRARRPQEDRHGDAAALGLVVRTGFNTTKGALVRSMLFPKPSGFKFYRDSFRYISVMAVVAAFGFIASLVNFIRLQVEWHAIIIRALDLVTIVVPPALPATLAIGTSFAVSRLKGKQIFCISPQRVNVAGKLDIMCFDKTGTLTEDGLDILGVRVAVPADGKFSETVSQPSQLAKFARIGESDTKSRNPYRDALFTMTTCHSLRSVDGELVGDPLDVKMFGFTEWDFEEGSHGAGDHDEEEHGGISPSIARPPRNSADPSDGDTRGETLLELGILKSFEFVSELRRASVIVRRFGQRSGDVYVKGAPEALKGICREESFPKDYDELLSTYTHQGYRVIGCATKHIPKLSWVKAQKMKREDVESGLDFVGFIIFENKLKPTTAAVLSEIREANIGTVMVTGDNILTAISVARKCGLMDKTAHCFVARFAEGTFLDPLARLQWESIDNVHLRLNPETLLPEPLPPQVDASLPYSIMDRKNYSLAISGDVFRWVVDFAPPLVLQRMLVQGKVYARMSPDEKHELVEKLQSIDYSCGFCGDGANDCGALKAADVGISLSEAEASVAAPFTSRVFDIRCVPEVMREGRASLVTSFSCFKYMSLYSAIQFTSVSFLYATASNLGDFQFLFIDLFLILPIAIFMSWAGPYPELCKKRPTANLVSRKVLVPLLGHMAIAIVIQAITYLAVRAQPWYIPPIIKHRKPNIRNSENTVLFLVSCFEYIFAGVVLNAGRPFRQPIRQNWPFLGTIIITLLLTLHMVLGPFRPVKKLMQLTKTRWDFQLFMALLGVVYLVIAWSSEVALFPWLARVFGVVKQRVTKREKKRKEYKLILEGIRM